MTGGTRGEGVRVSGWMRVSDGGEGGAHCAETTVSFRSTTTSVLTDTRSHREREKLWTLTWERGSLEKEREGRHDIHVICRHVACDEDACRVRLQGAADAAAAAAVVERQMRQQIMST